MKWTVHIVWGVVSLIMSVSLFGETTDDLEYSFETVGCLGACALGPMVVVDGEYHGEMNIAKTTKLLKKLGKKV